MQHDEAQVSPQDLMDLGQDAVPIAGLMGFVIDIVEPGYVVAHVPYKTDFVRPGGTVAGPVMMALADYVMWGVVMSLAGPSHMAVTSNLSINFLRRPSPVARRDRGTRQHSEDGSSSSRG